MSPIFGTKHSINKDKLYLPSIALNFFPKIVIFSFLLILLIPGISFVYGNDWSIKSTAIDFLFTLIFCGLLLLIVHLVFIRSATALSIEGNKLLLVTRNRCQESDLNLIDHFCVVTEISVAANGELHLKKLFIVKQQGERERIYTNYIANGLLQSWDKAAKRLKQISGKNVIFEYFFQDLDGQLIELDEYQKKQFQKRVPLFKSPYQVRCEGGDEGGV